MMWSERHANHLFIFHNGELVYKNYDNPEHPSILFNYYWPNEWVLPKKEYGKK